MIDAGITREAIALVVGDRQATYGPPAENLGRIAGMWSAYLGIPVSAADVAQMMVLVKVARARHAYKRDNAIDAVAYTLLADMLARPCE